MDDPLPSYESAIQQDPWELIAYYLPSETLCSAALVCQKWHEVFTPRLWGNPASHFGVQNDTVYVALTRFKRTLPYARLHVRQLTHTLHLPPAHAEIYGGPHAEWLRDCLERLPRLQCLIANGLPFLDHASLLTLRHSSLWFQANRGNVFPVFGLRLIDASGCMNVTSTGLAEALTHFPDLVSLDLSRTLAAKDETVLSKLKHLPNLRVLKLHGLGLKDSDFSTIAHAIGIRVRSLDVSNNNLTDASARFLLDYCLKEQAHEIHRTRGPLPPVEPGRLGGDLDAFGTEDLDSHLRKKLTEGFVGSLAIEDARDVGLTHLYISRNSVTVEGISGLLRSKRLQVLDVGTLPAVLQKPTFPDEEDEVIELPGVEKLTPILSEYASKRLSYLRINYKIVTEDAPVETVPSPRPEMEGDPGIYAPSGAHELEAIEPPIPELDAATTGVYELAGDLVRPTELLGSVPPSDSGDQNASATTGSTPVIGFTRAPTIEVTPEQPEIKRGPAYAPEPVFFDSPMTPVSPILAPDRNSLDAGSLSPVPVSPIDPTHSHASEETVQSTTRLRHNSTHFVEDRRARLDLRQSHENRLHPGMLPKVHTLVLTDVPTMTTDREVTNRLIQFVKDCAEETAIAKQRARYTYMLPPGRSRVLAEQEYTRGLFALRRIVFEMAPPQAAPKKISTSWRAYPTKSSTEDKDSEAFWDAAAHDFSFFGDEECGLPTLEPGRTLPYTAMSGLTLAPKRPAPPPKPREPEAPIRPLDVVSEIGQFRKSTKAAYNNLLQMGEVEPQVEGYWPGDITVIRKPIDSDSGNLDYYGNRFEGGWLYR